MTKSIHVNIEKSETWEQFKAYVENKHGKTHTVMGQELEKAILLYLASQGSAHTHKRKTVDTKLPIEEKKRPKSNLKAFEIVKETFIKNTSDADDFQRFYAERLIKDTMGVYDPRTIEKYSSELEHLWVLK